MFHSFFLSKKWALWAYFGLFLLLFFLYLQTSLSVAINEWYKDFYNVLQKPKIESLVPTKDSNQMSEAEFRKEADALAEENLNKANFLNKSSLYYYQFLMLKESG